MTKVAATVLAKRKVLENFLLVIHEWQVKRLLKVKLVSCNMQIKCLRGHQISETRPDKAIK